MRHIRFTDKDNFTTAILVKETALKKTSIEHYYVKPLVRSGVPLESLIAFDLKYDDNGKATSKFQKEYLSTLLKALDQLNITTLYVTDGAYFKTLTGERKAEPHYGYVLPCKIKGFEHMNVTLGVAYQRLIYDDRLANTLQLTLDTLSSKIQGSYAAIGTDIIHHREYPETVAHIKAFLSRLHQYPAITADFETFDLKFWRAGLGTVSFCWDQHSGGAFCIDYQEVLGNRENAFNSDVRELLKQFFEEYTGTIIWHNANFDCKIAIAQLWMTHLQDIHGLLDGLEIMTRNFHDTKIIAYLATNSCAGNNLSLKHLAHEFAGNYAQEDIDDILLIPKDKLLEYNLIDGLCTWYVFNKYYPKMLEDDQEEIYREIMLPSVKVILHMELVGMPLDMNRVLEVEREMTLIRQGFLDEFHTLPLIAAFEKYHQAKLCDKDFEKRWENSKTPLDKRADKIKRKDVSAFADEKFNPNSTPQLQVLLYEQLNLPVLDLTDTKLPATGADTLKKLKFHTTDNDVLILLDSLVGFFEVDKILGTFIKAFKENSVQKRDGWWWLHGNFNIGGTVSGRLSSSKPNLQNIPSTGSAYSKMIKSCFAAPPGAVFCGADFWSLEDRISGLTTRDPNKLKVYTDGFDGHSLRAVGYWPDQFPHIDPTDPKQVNLLKKEDHPLRQKGKGPTFLLTYQGTFMGIMAQFGFSEEEAKNIEARYHELYAVSDEWVAARLEQATHDGYVTVAFGLRVRTPMLAQCLWGNSRMPWEAKAEGRTAGNALGQSWGLLNNRAAIEFQRRLLASPYRTKILPCAHIHDAQYFVSQLKAEVLEWHNNNLVECMAWQDDPLIYHPEVPLGGDLDLFYPNWAWPKTLDNVITAEGVKQACREHKQYLVEEGILA